MAQTLRLDLRQSQSLVMTPQLQQAIKLLQLSNLELAEFIEGQLEQNPLLERAEDGAQGGPEAGEGNAPAADAIDPPGPNGEAGTTLDTVEVQKSAQLEDAPTADYDNLYTNNDASPGGEADGPAAFSEWGGGGSASFDSPDYNLEQTLATDETLREHLLTQLQIDVPDLAQRMIGMHLIDMLDEAGYVTGGLDDVADRLGCKIAEVEATLEQMQRFDPPGIFARDLRECLVLQLRERGQLYPAMEVLVDNLALLANHDAAALRKACGVDEELLAEMVAEIRALDPKPGLAFDLTTTQTVTPDVTMRPQPGGGWVVELNTENLPKVLVNNRYYAKVSKGTHSKSDKEYLVEALQSANWLVKSLHQRATTILKVSTELVRQQDAFFAHGVQHLKPLVLRDIAEAIEMHESTVSRVTTNKFMATPRGLFELKYFFSSAVGGGNGSDPHASEAVRDRICVLIDDEDPSDVLSDDKIVEILEGDGVQIARRTVAKYREGLKIASSVQRRRQKNATI